MQNATRSLSTPPQRLQWAGELRKKVGCVNMPWPYLSKATPLCMLEVAIEAAHDVCGTRDPQALFDAGRGTRDDGRAAAWNNK